VRIRNKDDVSVLIIANFVVWNWALEEHPKPKTNPICYNWLNRGG
jgi:hypothetical protein